MLECRRCGKHLEVKQLWLHEQVRSGKIDFQKDPPQTKRQRRLHSPLHEGGNALLGWRLALRGPIGRGAFVHIFQLVE